MRKFSTLLLFFLAFSPLVFASCEMNIKEWVPDEKADERYSVKAGLAIDVEVSPSQEETTEVICGDDLRPFVKVLKKASTYIVTYDLAKVKEVYGSDERFSSLKGASMKHNQIVLCGIPFKSSKVLVKLGLNELKGLCSATSSTIICKGQWEIDTLSLGTHSAGKIKIETPLKAKCLAIKGSSSGRIDGAFEVKSQAKIKLSSGASAKLELKAKEVHFKGSSGSFGKLHLNVEQSHFVLSSGSNAKVLGSAKELSIRVSSGADFKGKKLSYETLSKEQSSGGSIHL